MNRRGHYVNSDLIDLLAYIALVLAGMLYLVSFILKITESQLGFMGVLGLIRDIALALGVGLAAYRFTAGKGKAVKIIYWIALIAYLVFAVLYVIKF